MAENQPKKAQVILNFQAPVNAAVGNVEGDMIVNPKQRLADSATEIEQLLQILNRNYPADIPDDTKAKMDEAIAEIEKKPTLKERILSLLKSGGIEALKEITDNPYVNVLVAAYEGWQYPQ